MPPKLHAQDPYIVYLQPTSPLRTAIHIDDAFNQMQRNNAHKLISVVEMAKSPFKSFILDRSGLLEALFDEDKTNARRQDLPRVYLPNGAIYIFRLSDFNCRSKFPSNGSMPYFMSDKDSLDIDTEADFDLLNAVLGANLKSSNHRNL